MDYKMLMEALLGNLDEGILVTDERANITFYKEMAGNIAGVDPNQIVGRNILEVFPDLTAETSSFYKVLQTQTPLIERIQHYTNHKGKPVSIVSSTMPLFEAGKLVGAFEIFKDLTQMVDLSEQIVNLQTQLHGGSQKTKKPKQAGAEYTFDSILGKSDVVETLKSKAMRIANSDSPVLVYGETGTGKELLVQAMHNASALRSQKPFIAQNCAALPSNLLESILFGSAAGSYTGAKEKPGLFELADGGTLFLDELNALDVTLQAKLLRVLQDGHIRRVGGAQCCKVNVRVIAATNEKPETLIARGALREDLFYRLRVVYLQVPPLRARQEDIGLLLDHFLAHYAERLKKPMPQIDQEARLYLEAYSWPGNVREMAHLVEGAMNLLDKPTWHLTDLADSLYERVIPDISEGVRLVEAHPKLEGKSLNDTLSDLEVKLIETAIFENLGNYAGAARQLGLPKQTLQNKLKKYNISWAEMMQTKNGTASQK